MENLIFVGVFGLVAVVGAGFIGLRWWAANAPRPTTLGVAADGRLAPCPGSPNCVTSQTGLESQLMPALSFTDTQTAAQDRLRSLITAMPRAQIITDRPGYLHAEFRTPTIGYIDDVEFLLDAEQGLIHFRSAARLGYGDAGVNRNRMLEVSRLWDATGRP